MLPSTKELKLPTCKQLKDEKPDVLIKADIGEGIITVFQNGFFKYEESDHATVYAVDRCNELTWIFQNGDRSTIDETCFSDCIWTLPLQIIGSDRIEHNREKAEDDHIVYHLDDYDFDRNSELCEYDTVEKKIEEEEAEKQKLYNLQKLRIALNALTVRQREIIGLYYYDGLTQNQIAVCTGLGRRTVREHLNAVHKKFTKIF